MLCSNLVTGCRLYTDPMPLILSRADEIIERHPCVQGNSTCARHFVRVVFCRLYLGVGARYPRASRSLGSLVPVLCVEQNNIERGDPVYRHAKDENSGALRRYFWWTYVDDCFGRILLLESVRGESNNLG